MTCSRRWLSAGTASGLNRCRPRLARATGRLGDALYGAVAERLQENAVTPVPDQVQFRLDWPRFFASLSARDRRLAAFLALGHSGRQAAGRFRLSPGRVTQLRQQWRRQWRAFVGEDHDAGRSLRPASA